MRRASFPAAVLELIHWAALHDRGSWLPAAVLFGPLVGFWAYRLWYWVLRRFARHLDERGALAELFRAEWTPDGAFLQWNLVESRGNVLRGVHVHPRHSDYLFMLSGSLLLVLHDLRPVDPGKPKSLFLTLSGDDPTTVCIPKGVCHGIWLSEPTSYVYDLGTGWNMNDELGCPFDDPALSLDWPAEAPILSPRDAKPTDSYAGMRAAWIATQAVV